MAKTRSQNTGRTTKDRGASATEAARAADAAKLEALKQRLYEDVAILRQAGDDRTPYGGDFESLVAAAQLASQQETDELLRRRLERRLSELERVNRRLEQGQYGVCEACGAEIPAERLAAVPDTTLCVRCQGQRERRGGSRRAA
ncbi:MAG: TraR/DksA family transcriptional regulator [Chloroflexota bacterium]